MKEGVPETGADLHVTLRSPISVKVMGAPVSFLAFDAREDYVRADFIDYQVVRLYSSAAKPIAMRIKIHVHVSNIAGWVAQPFEGSK